MEKEFKEKKKRKDSIKAGEIIKEHGLSVFMAAVFLAGELAGSGALKLPAALVGTGKIYISTNGIIKRDLNYLKFKNGRPRLINIIENE